MSEISFFTPVYYGINADSHEKEDLEYIDSYFHICGKRAVVIPGRTEDGMEKVLLQKDKFTIGAFLKTIMIAVSFFTVVIPLAMLIGKVILRSRHHYKVVDPKKNELPEVKKIFPNFKAKIEDEHQQILDPQLSLEKKVPQMSKEDIQSQIKIEEEYQQILDQQLSFEVDTFEREILEKTPQDSKETIQLFFLFYKYRIEIFQSYKKSIQNGRDKVTEIQKRHNLLTLPIFYKGTNNPKQDLRDIAHSLTIIKVLHEAYQTNPKRSHLLLEKIKNGCFTQKKTCLYNWISKESQGGAKREEEILKEILFDIEKPWEFEKLNLLYKYIEKNPQTKKETAFEEIKKFIGVATFQKKKVSDEDILKLVEDHWDKTYELIYDLG